MIKINFRKRNDFNVQLQRDRVRKGREGSAGKSRKVAACGFIWCRRQRAGTGGRVRLRASKDAHSEYFSTRLCR